ncbi:MAG: sodium:solute symporter family protein, partial [bacterium]
AKIHTPIQPTLQADARLVKENAQNMQRFDSSKLFPGTQWELHKPLKTDYIGFFGTWGLVGLILLLLWMIMNITF